MLAKETWQSVVDDREREALLEVTVAAYYLSPLLSTLQGYGMDVEESMIFDDEAVVLAWSSNLPGDVAGALQRDLLMREPPLVTDIESYLR